MRRLLFNPLAQKPYASGEYSSVNKIFLLDKKLEKGLYIYVMHTEETGAKVVVNIGLLYLNTNNISADKVRDLEIVYQSVNTPYDLQILDGEEDYIRVNNIITGLPIDESYNYTMYLYKVF